MGLTPGERQRRYYERKCAEWAALPPIPCLCGCGTLIPPVNKMGKPARYVAGHYHPGGAKPGNIPWNKGKACPQLGGGNRGKKLSSEEISRRKATRLANNGGVYQRARGWQHAPETLAKMREANRRNAKAGEANPFYGKHHAPESRARMGARGEQHPHWKGGTGTLPYGPEFTKKFKRLIRERDKQTCQRCGKTRAEQSRALPVHHRDRNKANNDPTNLVTVCNSCHRWLHWHPGEPFALAAPAP